MDFNQINFALGDVVTFHENLLVLRDTYNCKLIDLCIVEDLKKKPAQPKKHMVLQATKLNPYIGEIFEFNNRNNYNYFMRLNMHKYIMFPQRMDQTHADHRGLLRYQKIHNKIPRMFVDRSSLDWAKKIISENVKSKKLIVIQIRNSLGIKNPSDFPAMIEGKSGAVLRNSNLPEWEKFLINIDKERFQVICVCSKQEVIPLWREKGIVIFSKDLDADVMKDFALIQCSYLSLFPSSGMFEFAIYSGTPFCVLNPPQNYWKNKLDPLYQINGVLLDGNQFSYQTPLQKIAWGKKDTFKEINYHFNVLVKEIENHRA
jgi:hypothetical protein